MRTLYVVASDQRLTSAVTIRCLLALRSFHGGATVQNIARIVGTTPRFARIALRELEKLGYAVASTPEGGRLLVWRAL